jgi:hypothetical protein
MSAVTNTSDMDDFTPRLKLPVKPTYAISGGSLPKISR